MIQDLFQKTGRTKDSTEDALRVSGEVFSDEIGLPEESVPYPAGDKPSLTTLSGFTAEPRELNADPSIPVTGNLGLGPSMLQPEMRAVTMQLRTARESEVARISDGLAAGKERESDGTNQLVTLQKSNDEIPERVIVKSFEKIQAGLTYFSSNERDSAWALPPSKSKVGGNVVDIGAPVLNESRTSMDAATPFEWAPNTKTDDAPDDNPLSEAKILTAVLQPGETGQTAQVPVLLREDNNRPGELDLSRVTEQAKPVSDEILGSNPRRELTPTVLPARRLANLVDAAHRDGLDPTTKASRSKFVEVGILRSGDGSVPQVRLATAKTFQVGQAMQSIMPRDVSQARWMRDDHTQRLEIPDATSSARPASVETPELSFAKMDAKSQATVAGRAFLQPIPIGHPETDAPLIIEGVEAFALEERNAHDTVRRAEQASKAEYQPRPVMAQLANAVGKLMPDGTLEIRLSPEDLGRVRVTLVPGDFGISVQLLVERSDTLELVRRHIDILEQDLLQQGFSDMSFSSRQEQSMSDQEEYRDETKRLDEGFREIADAKDLKTVQREQAMALGRLDLRL